MLPFIEYVFSDKSMYDFASTVIDSRTNKPFIDPDNDFKVGASGGFLLNIDFQFIDTDIFSKVAHAYEENKKNPDLVAWIEGLDVSIGENKGKYYYCPHVKGTNEYNEFWKQETYRRRNGMTAKCKLKDGSITDLHITGDHYNYLNYGRILRTPTKQEQIELHEKGDYKTKLVQGFPRFWDGDYWNFKIDRFIADNNYHLTKAKARGKGYSYKRGSQAANTINIIPFATVILAAYDLAYLTDQGATSDMVKTNLDWYEENTHWKRFYLSEKLDAIELGYKTKKGGNKKFGFRSKALSVSLFNNPSAAIGKRALEIDFEESGKCNNLDQALDVTLSSTEVGAGNVGTIRCYGTAGVKGADWRPFSTAFYNPANYKMMPFENIWDDNSRRTVCGFFHPQVLNMEPFIDQHGNSLLLEAEKYDIEDKKKYAAEQSVDKWLTYVGQRANKPAEAFKTANENIYSSPGLSAHISELQSNPALSYYRDGMLFEIGKKIVFKTNKQLIAEGLEKYAHPYIEDVPFNPKKDFYGCIREFYPPYTIEGRTPDNLYTVVFDSVAKDKKTELVINKNSLNSIHVLMHPTNLPSTTGDIIVAAYAGRPETMEEINRIVLYLCEHYNAKVLPEVDRGTIVSDFKKWGKLHLIMQDPTDIISNRIVGKESINYGINMGSGDNSTESHIYLKEWLYNKRAIREDGQIVYSYHYIKDLPTLLEIENFNLTGNFDRISSLKLYPFANKVRQIKKLDEAIKAVNNVSIHSQIGLYGYKD